MNQIFNRVQFTLFLPDLQIFFFENNPHVVYFPDGLRPKIQLMSLYPQIHLNCRQLLKLFKYPYFRFKQFSCIVAVIFIDNVPKNIAKDLSSLKISCRYL